MIKLIPRTEKKQQEPRQTTNTAQPVAYTQW